MLRLEHLAELVEKNRDAARATVAEFSIGSKPFNFNASSFLMGVINLSAESWYRESVCLSPDRAIERGVVLHAQGADIIDIGAESTLAQAARIDPKVQDSQLLPVLRELHGRQILLSVETYHPSLSAACLKAGANVINLTGSHGSEEIYRLVAEHDAAVIICYVQGANVREVGEFDFGRDPLESMYDYFARQIDLARQCGVSRVLIDPGLGFYYRNLQDSATRVRHQMRVFLNTFRLRSLGYPVCHALPHAFEFFGEEVRSAEPFFAVLAALGKTDLFRTHEVTKTRSVLSTLAAY